MKISVLGNIIDTEDIYQITPIKENQFNINFFNSKSLTIYRSFYELLCKKFIEETNPSNELKQQLKNSFCLYISPELYEYEINNKEKITKECERQLETIRNVIISYWSNNQSQIPKIEFI